jgi:YHS domain-containing protein
MFRLAVLLMAVFFVGCSVEPAPLMTIPSGHPGHADSGNVPYRPPSDQLKGDVAPPPAEEKKSGHEGHDHHGKGDQAKPAAEYPLDVCVVSGEKLGSMGKPVILEHNGREVRLCCPNCTAEFKKDPEKYMKKLDEAEKKKSEEKKKDEPKHDHHGGNP